MSDKIEKYIYPTQTAVKLRNAKCSNENMKMETPSHAESARGSYLLTTRNSSSSELMFHVKDSPFSSTVTELMILDHCNILVSEAT